MIIVYSGCVMNPVEAHSSWHTDNSLNRGNEYVNYLCANYNYTKLFDDR